MLAFSEKKYKAAKISKFYSEKSKEDCTVKNLTPLIKYQPCLRHRC
jgi:hypothetical protein